MLIQLLSYSLHTLIACFQKNCCGLSKYCPCLVSSWRHSFNTSFSVFSFASTSKHCTQTGRGLFSGPTFVNPSDRHSLEYFLSLLLYVLPDLSWVSDNLFSAVNSQSAGFHLTPGSHCSMLHPSHHWSSIPSSIIPCHWTNLLSGAVLKFAIHSCSRYR